MRVRRALAGAEDAAGTDAGWAVHTAATATIVVVRAVAVLSIGALLILGPSSAQRHRELAFTMFAMAAVYGLLTLRRPIWEVRRTASAGILSAVDATLALFAVAVTGGAQSPAIATLFLVVVAAAIRLSPRAAVGVTSFVVSSLALIVLLVDAEHIGSDARLFASMWWPVLLVLTAALASSLSVVAEREQHARLRATVELEAEHAAAEEERDLRERLVESYEAQQDGLRVILHEFRTPVVSLDALAKEALSGTDPESESQRLSTLNLILEHAGHLTEMLNALSDVAASRAPGFGKPHVRTVDVRALVEAAADAARLPWEHLRVTVDDRASAIDTDGQRLRRVVTNLLENAARHGAGRPVDVTVESGERRLIISVADRGPGVADEALAEITGRNVTLGERQGTAGLGLWIVQQILQAMGGSLRFMNRPGGGLIARCEIPLR